MHSASSRISTETPAACRPRSRRCKAEFAEIAQEAKQAIVQEMEREDELKLDRPEWPKAAGPEMKACGRWRTADQLEVGDIPESGKNWVALRENQSEGQDRPIFTQEHRAAPVCRWANPEITRGHLQPQEDLLPTYRMARYRH